MEAGNGNTRENETLDGLGETVYLCIQERISRGIEYRTEYIWRVETTE